MNPAPGFAALSRDDVTLLLNTPGAGGAGTAAGTPEPGGWNRFQPELTDLTATVERLQSADCTFRGNVAEGNGRKQILIDDPSGNIVELFEPHSDR